MWFESKSSEEKKAEQAAEDDEKMGQTWLQRSRERGTLSQHIIVFLYLLINLIIMGVTLYQWEVTVYNAYLLQCPPGENGWLNYYLTVWRRTLSELLGALGQDLWGRA